MRPPVRAPRRRVAIPHATTQRAARTVHPAVPRGTAAGRLSRDCRRLLPQAADGAVQRPARRRLADPPRDIPPPAPPRAAPPRAIPPPARPRARGRAAAAARPRSRRRQRLALAPALRARPPRRGRRCARRRCRRARRGALLRDGVRGRAGRLRRAAIRAGTVRSRRLQWLAALRAGHGRHARARPPHARAGRRAGRDGLADVRRRRRRFADGERQAAPLRDDVRYQRRDAAGHRLSHLCDPRRNRRAAQPEAAVRAVARPVDVAAAPQSRAGPAAPRARRLRTLGGAMIVLFNPLSTSPGKQPLPLSLMSLAAVLEARGDAWSLVDGNLSANPAADIIARLVNVPAGRVPLLGVTVMPGPQLAQALQVCRAV